MLQAAQRGKKSSSKKAAPKIAVHERFLEAFRWMLLARILEDKLGSLYRGGPRENQLAMISHLGAMIPVMVGKLVAKRMKGEKGFVGLTTLGEGGMQTGAAHEGLNIAAVEQVPLVVVVTNNHWAYSTPNEREFACANLVDRAIGYGYEGHKMDGTDLNQCIEVIERAVKRARAGRPPQLVVAEVLRLAGHGEHDDASYVPAEMKNQPFAQDPVARTEKFILDNGLLDRDALQQMRAEIAKQIDEAVATAQQEDAPHAREEDWRAVSTDALIDNPSA